MIRMVRNTNTGCIMVVVGLLALLLLSAASAAEVHTLRYCFTTDLSPGLSQPSYQAVGQVDDVQIARYNKETRRVEPLLRWMEMYINPQHWENQTQIARYYEVRQREIIQDLIKYFRHDKDGQHWYTLQVLFSCQISRDGSVSGYEEFAANGNQIIALDTFLSKFIALTPGAEEMAASWNNRKSSVEKQKWYMEQECNRWFKDYLYYMEEVLKPVHPEVKVWGRQSPDGVTRLQCLVYGFHPKAVYVRWVRNGTEEIHSDKAGPVLPHPDGTYQIRVSVEVPTLEGDTYSCHVEHSSLEETLISNMIVEDSEGFKMEQPIFRWVALIAVFSIILLGFMVTLLVCRRHPDTGQRESVC